jgi:hypothetical protein
VVDDALMAGVKLDRLPGPPLRTGAVGGLAFTFLYLLHRLLQGTGPDSSTAVAVAAYSLAHRGALLASEVAVGLALLAFIGFLAALVPVIWRAGQESLAVAVVISGGVFVAMGFVSTAAETALIGVADSDQPAAVLALDQLQGRTPIVWTITALVAVLSLAIQRTGLVWRWLGVVGLLAAVIFLLGSVVSVLGRTPEQNSSLVGIGLFIVWMLVLSAGLWRSAASSIYPRPSSVRFAESLAGDGVEDPLGVVLQLGLAVLEAPVGTGGRGGAEHIPQPQLAMPATQPFQALFLLVQLGQGQLGLGDLGVELGQVLATLGQEFDPFGLAGGGVDGRQPLGVGRLAAGGVQHDRLPAGRLDQLDRAGDAVGEGGGRGGQPGRLAERDGAGAAQPPPHRHSVARGFGRHPEQQHDPLHELMLLSL